MKVNQFYDVDIPRNFECRNCGVNVYINVRKDKRCVFCSKECEKQYWRLESKKNRYAQKRNREYTSLRNYSNKDFMIKLWREKKKVSIIRENNEIKYIIVKDDELIAMFDTLKELNCFIKKYNLKDFEIKKIKIKY